MRTSLLICTLAMFVVLAGCKTGKGSPAGNLQDTLDTVQAEYVILNLATGARVTSSVVPDYADPRYRTTHMVFRRVDGGSTTLGSPIGSRWAQPDEALRTTNVPTYFLGVFEVTRAQWLALGGGDPASAITPAALAETMDPLVPVHGLSLLAARMVLGAWPGGGALGIPSADQWERACRAGSTTLFSWGDATDPSIVRANAVVANISSGGVLPVGARDANAWGFFDMHGNVWEWTADGQLCGGSWNDTLPMARSANRLAMDQETAYALAGIRLTYAP